MPAPTNDTKVRSALDLALELAAIGWHVLPLSATSKRPLGLCDACRAGTRCSAGSIEDCPCLPAGRWCHGVRAATLDPARLRAWWRAQPDAIPAVAAGPSGLVLIDLDTHADQAPELAELLPGIDLLGEHLAARRLPEIRDGRDVLRLLAELRGGPGPWPADPGHRPVTVATPSGGRHLWYRAPADGLHQALSKLGWQIDIKAGWSYGIAPGAIARTGPYEILAGDLTALGRMPQWLAREVIRVAGTPRPARTPLPAQALPVHHQGPPAYLTAVIERGAADLVTLTDGRQRALSALAYKAGGYLDWSGLPRQQIEERLISAGTTSGLAERLARRIVTRSLANGLRFPLAPPEQRATASTERGRATCRECSQPMTVYEAGQTTHPMCDPIGSTA